MKWGKWSTTASSNSATPPDGWPEGQLPSTVNDCAREMMASIRTGISNIQFVDQGLSAIQTSTTTFTVTGDQSAYFEYGRRVLINAGVYGSVISATFTTNTGVTIRLDPGANQTGFGSISAVASGFPSDRNGALPDSVFNEWINPVTNGAFDIWVRGSSFAWGTNSNTYAADRWGIITRLSAGAGTIQRFELSANSSNVPTMLQAGVLLNNSIGVSVSAACASLAAANQGSVCHFIEGYDFRHIAQRPFTASFWVNSTKTGTYCLAFNNAGGDRYIVMEYAVSAASTWEYKTITFPESPAAGTWDYSDGVGVAMRFILACGSGAQGGAGNWTSTAILATSNQTNFFSSAGNVIKFTAVQIDIGTQAKPYRQTLHPVERKRCDRFCQLLPLSGVNRWPGQAVNATQAYATFQFEEMHAVPSATYTLGGMAIINEALSTISLSAVVTANSGLRHLTVLGTQNGGGNLTQGRVCYFAFSAGTGILLNAELF